MKQREVENDQIGEGDTKMKGGGSDKEKTKEKGE